MNSTTQQLKKYVKSLQNVINDPKKVLSVFEDLKFWAIQSETLPEELLKQLDNLFPEPRSNGAIRRIMRRAINAADKVRCERERLLKEHFDLTLTLEYLERLFESNNKRFDILLARFTNSEIVRETPPEVLLEQLQQFWLRSRLSTIMENAIKAAANVREFGKELGDCQESSHSPLEAIPAFVDRLNRIERHANSGRDAVHSERFRNKYAKARREGKQLRAMQQAAHSELSRFNNLTSQIVSQQVDILNSENLKMKRGTGSRRALKSELEKSRNLQQVSESSRLKNAIDLAEHTLKVRERQASKHSEKYYRAIEESSVAETESTSAGSESSDLTKGLEKVKTALKPRKHAERRYSSSRRRTSSRF